jgi:hypothetical protein
VKPTSYSIVVEGELSQRYANAFDAMQLETRHGTTTIVGLVQDEAELRGLLDTVSELGLALVSVTPVAAPTPPS